MICMKPKCCMNCKINSECPVCCGFNNKDTCESVGILSLNEFEEVYCDTRSFRNLKNLDGESNDKE